MAWGKYFVILIILFFDFLAMIYMGLKASFLRELFLLTLFLIIALIMVLGMYSKKSWAYVLGALFFIAYLVNLFYVYFGLVRGKLSLVVFAVSSLAAALGFLISIVGIGSKDEAKEEIKVEPYDYESKFEPGKYIASKNAAYYHAPKCDWAKKISKRNIVWLESEEEARKKGLKKHSCLG